MHVNPNDVSRLNIALFRCLVTRVFVLIVRKILCAQRLEHKGRIGRV